MTAACELWFRPLSGGRYSKVFEGSFRDCVGAIIGGRSGAGDYQLRERRGKVEPKAVAGRDTAGAGKYAADLFAGVDG